MSKGASSGPGHITSRLFAGLLGGLLAANGLGALLSLLIPDRLSAYYVTGLGSGFVLTLAFLWAFRARSAGHVWGMMMGVAAFSGLLTWLLMLWGAGA